MTDAQHDDNAMIVALMERLTEQRLPRSLDIKEKVDAGGTLDEYDLNFLEDMVRDSAELKPFIDRHPEFHEIAAKLIHLHHEITERALANEGAAPADDA